MRHVYFFYEKNILGKCLGKIFKKLRKSKLDGTTPRATQYRVVARFFVRRKKEKNRNTRQLENFPVFPNIITSFSTALN